jgi:hypothetical protein
MSRLGSASPTTTMLVGDKSRSAAKLRGARRTTVACDIVRRHHRADDASGTVPSAPTDTRVTAGRYATACRCPCGWQSPHPVNTAAPYTCVSEARVIDSIRALG